MGEGLVAGSQRRLEVEAGSPRQEGRELAGSLAGAAESQLVEPP